MRGIENSPHTHIDTKDWKRAEHIKNMEAQEIIDKVNGIMAKKAGIEASEIKPKDFYDELGVDEENLYRHC